MGQYVAGQSLLHRADPRAKIILVFALVILLFRVEAMVTLLFMGFVLATLLAVARVPVAMLRRSLKPVYFVMALSVVIQAVTVPGPAIAVVGPLTITEQGIAMGLFISLRLVLLILFAALMSATTMPVALADGLEYLLAPLRRIRVPAHELAMMVMIAMRFIPTMLVEADSLVKAQRARGASFGTGGLMAKIRSVVPIIVPLFVAAFRRADDLAVAMEARGYTGGAGRSKYRELRMSGADYSLLLGGAVLFLSVALFLR